MSKLKEAFWEALKSMYKSLPIIVGILMLVALAKALIPQKLYTDLFSGNYITDPLIGAVLGSIMAGNPITSYIIGGELLKGGVGLLAVTAFLVAWVTVGIIQLPAEAAFLGKKFAIYRNISAFFLAIIVALITVLIVNII